MSIEAMKQVKQELEHIKHYGYATDIDHAIKTLGHAIVEAQKQKPWVSLTDDEIAQVVGSPIDEVYLSDFRNVEAKLKERNNG